MRLIYEEEFNSIQFELREGFSDFSLCPYGNVFSQLGYDITNNEYVCLDKAILRSKKNNQSEILNEI